MSDLITAQTPTADHVRLALSLMADGAHMVLSGVPDDPSLATYSFPGHVSKALHAQLADAQAAQAAVVERCAEVVSQGWCEPETANTIMDVELGMAIQAVIRRLAPIDGLALVRELRAELNHRHELHLEQVRITNTCVTDHDTLAATNAALEAKLARLVEAQVSLVKAASEVSRLGAVTESQWTRLNIALLNARASLAEVQARDNAPDTAWHERRTMLPDGDARKGEG